MSLLQEMLGSWRQSGSWGGKGCIGKAKGSMAWITASEWTIQNFHSLMLREETWQSYSLKYRPIFLAPRASNHICFLLLEASRRLWRLSESHGLVERNWTLPAGYGLSDSYEVLIGCQLLRSSPHSWQRAPKLAELHYNWQPPYIPEREGLRSLGDSEMRWVPGFFVIFDSQLSCQGGREPATKTSPRSPPGNLLRKSFFIRIIGEKVSNQQNRKWFPGPGPLVPYV